MVVVFQNVANIMTAVGDCILYGAGVDCLVLAAFGIMLAGVIGYMMAEMNSANVSQTGLFWMLSNCLCTSGYILYLKFATKSVKLSKFGMVFYNNVLCTLFLFPVMAINGQLGKFLGTKALHTADYVVMNALAGFVGFFLNFASLNCIAQTGPTTYAMLGSLNKVLVGYLIFDNAISEWTLTGCNLYTFAKIGRYIESQHALRSDTWRDLRES